MMDFLLKSISPAKGFTLIKHHLENNIKKTFDSFDILFDVTENAVSFQVYHADYEKGIKNFPFEGGKKFIKVALSILEDKLPKEAKNALIDKAIATYREINGKAEITGYLFYSLDGKKQPPVTHKF